MKFLFVSHVPFKTSTWALGQIMEIFYYYISEFFLYTMIYVYGNSRLKYPKWCYISQSASFSKEKLIYVPTWMTYAGHYLCLLLRLLLWNLRHFKGCPYLVKYTCEVYVIYISQYRV